MHSAGHPPGALAPRAQQQQQDAELGSKPAGWEEGGITFTVLVDQRLIHIT